jgi:hypothetical protein
MTDVMDVHVICADMNEFITTNFKGLAKQMNQVLILHDASLHTSLCTREAIATMGWTIFPSSPHSPDLPTFNFHLFVSLKDALRGCCVLDNNDLQLSLCEELRCFSKHFYDTSIKPLMQQLKMCVDD